MVTTKDYLYPMLRERLEAAGVPSEEVFREASEVIVFGSSAVGLQRTDSDIDVLVIGGRPHRRKNELLDLLWISVEERESTTWLHCELASHVAEYGVWLKGSPSWLNDVRVGRYVIGHKRRRIAAFLRSLPAVWPVLEECFRVKYALKLRRETQRLVFLEDGFAVPPTTILDEEWSAQLSSTIEERLGQLALEPKNSFLQDIFMRFATQRAVTGRAWRKPKVFEGGNSL